MCEAIAEHPEGGGGSPVDVEDFIQVFKVFGEMLKADEDDLKAAETFLTDEATANGGKKLRAGQLSAARCPSIRLGRKV